MRHTDGKTGGEHYSERRRQMMSSAEDALKRTPEAELRQRVADLRQSGFSVAASAVEQELRRRRE